MLKKPGTTEEPFNKIQEILKEIVAGQHGRNIVIFESIPEKRLYQSCTIFVPFMRRVIKI